MQLPGALETFTDKWRARWPEWRVAMAFVPVEQRDLVAAWFALQQELTDAAWAGEDPAPGLAKLAWWQEELLGWGKGARRHPLGTVLQPIPAPWATLAHGLPSLQASRARPGEPAAGDALVDFAGAMAMCESALFDAKHRSDGARSMAALKASLRAEQALFHPKTAVEDAEQDSEPGAATRPRRIHAALLRAALADAAHPRAPVARRNLSPWRTLTVAWRAARGR